MEDDECLDLIHLGIRHLEQVEIDDKIKVEMFNFISY